MSLRRRTIAVLACLAMVAGCRRTDDSTITISAAASLSDVLRVLVVVFREENPGIRIRTNFAGSSRLAQQLVHGAPTDIFVSADAVQLDRVAKAGLVAERHELVTNRLVLVAPASSGVRAGEIRAVLAATSGRIAIGDETVPAGTYARVALQRSGSTSLAKGRLTPLGHVRQVLATVVSHNAELGFVYATDVPVARGAVRVVAELGPELTGHIRYPIARIRGRGGKAADALYRWLRSPRAAAAFRAAGFSPAQAVSSP